MLEGYSCPQVANVWTENHKLLLWSRIEIAFLKHFNGVLITPLDTFSDEWVREVNDIEQRTKHDVAAFVEWLEKYLQNRFVHFGLTSSDVADTAFSLQIKESNDELDVFLSKAGDALLALAEKYKEVTIIGRTHGQVAEPIPLRNKFVAYYDALWHFRPRGPYYGKLSGSTGDYKYFSPDVEKSTLADLGLIPSPVKDGQIIHRAVYAEYMNQWAVLASVIAKIATDIRLLSQTEIGEFREGFAGGQVGSSSMPHKRNPVLSENLCGLARVIRGYQTTALQNVELWLERDISHSSGERVVFPDASILLGFMLMRLTEVLKSLQIDVDIINTNMFKYKNMMGSQARMLQLIEGGLSRHDAHAKISGSSE